MYLSDYYFKGGDEFLPTPVFRPPPKLPASRVSLGTSVISVGSSFSKYTLVIIDLFVVSLLFALTFYLNHWFC